MHLLLLGNPEDYKTLAVPLTVGQKISRKDLIFKFIHIQYERNEIDRRPGTFQVMGNSIEVQIPYQKEKLRIELFGDTIEAMYWVSKMNNSVVQTIDDTIVFPAKHFVTTDKKFQNGLETIAQELLEWAPTLTNPIYKERIEKRVAHDLEMLREVGYCSGVENYSAHFDGRARDETPHSLFDFFPKDFLLVVDESHMALPQLRGMYAGDRARKKSLIEFGFRLPSAYDNRPLKFEEIESYFKDVVFISATPGEYELRHSNNIVEQIIRPTGLVDPQVEVRSRKGQIDDLVAEIKATTDKGLRSLVIVLTKKLAEDMARYLEERQIKVCYLHSELKTPQRTELLQKLRLGIFDCLVGVNLLREGIDLPELALVAIMDADIESFLRDKRSLIQIIGRAARNIQSKVILYADKITNSMRDAIDETNRRRQLQETFNTAHNITPVSVQREVTKSITDLQKAIAQASKMSKKKKKEIPHTIAEIELRIADIETEMAKAAESFDFEHAIALRDEWFMLKKRLAELEKK